MTIKKFEVAPGINKNTTELEAEGAYTCCDKARFRYGKPQKIGGWVQESYTGTVSGVSRDIYSWIDFDETKYLGIGTNEKLYVMTGGSLYDVTPIRASSTGVSVLTVETSGCAEVKLSVNPQGAQAGDQFIMQKCPASVAGINLVSGGQYTIASVGASYITFYSSGSAISNASAHSKGTSVEVNFLLETGLANNGQSYGWGAGTWSTPGASASAGWSEPRSGGVSKKLRQWSLDNWGEDLIACPYGGKIYTWKASAGTSVRASIISSAAPSVNNIVKVIHPSRQVASFGTHNASGDFDPMLIRWTDKEDYTTWTAAATNQAGSFRLGGGSEILGVEETRREFLVFTDEKVYSMTYIGGTLVFGFTDLGRHNGLVSQNASVDVNGVVFWMGNGSFHMYDGTIQVLPCTLHQYLFNPDSAGSVNFTQKEKIYASTNREFNEIWWFYPSRDSLEIDRYVVYNYLEHLWYYGTMDRTVFLDSDIFSRPYAIDTSGTIFIHEQGKDAGTSGMKSFIQSSFVDIADGDDMLFIQRVIPDHDITKELNYNITYKKYPQDTETFSKGAYTVTPDIKKFHPRIRARQMKIAYSTSILGGDYRLGCDRLDIKPDGKR